MDFISMLSFFKNLGEYKNVCMVQMYKLYIYIYCVYIFAVLFIIFSLVYVIYYCFDISYNLEVIILLYQF